MLGMQTGAGMAIDENTVDKGSTTVPTRRNSAETAETRYGNDAVAAAFCFQSRSLWSTRQQILCVPLCSCCDPRNAVSPSSG